jgi:hypothetical protein
MIEASSVLGAGGQTVATTTGTLKAAFDCSSCGRSIGRDETYALTSDRRPVCNDCMAAAEPRLAAADPLAALIASHPPTVVRTYSGPDEAAAARALDSERRRLAEAGYGLLAQTWAPTERPIITGVAGVIVLLFGLFLTLFVAGGFLLGMISALVGLALLAAYAGNTRAGRLTATFQANPAAELPAGDAASISHRPAADRLRELEALKDAGLITDDELAARRSGILDSI